MGNIWKRLFSKNGGADAVAVMAAYPEIDHAVTVTRIRTEEVIAAAPVGSGSFGQTALLNADIEDRFYRLVLGMPDTAQKPMRAPEVTMLRRLNALCGGDRFDVASLPRMPEVLPQLLRLLKSDEADGVKLAKLIGRDPVLVGEVMRVSKSAHYRTLQPVISLQHAVVLLGQDGLRRMVTQHVMKPILQASAGMFGHVAGQRLWDHAERCSHACMFLAKGKSDLFEAYLAGIVCNVGVGAMVRVLDQEAPPNLGVFSHEFLVNCVGIGSHLSLRAAQCWELPPSVIDALRERMAPATTETSSNLGSVLLAGDHLAMIQLLIENHRVPRTAQATEDRCDGLPSSLLERAQQDLQRNFSAAG